MRPQIGPRKSALIQLPADGTPAWAPIKGETHASRVAFEQYIAAGPTRTLEGFAKNTGRRPGTVQGWSSKYLWTQRALQFDQHCLIEAERLRAHEMVKVAKEQAEGFGDLRRKAVAEVGTRDLTQLDTMDVFKVGKEAAGEERKAVGLDGGHAGRAAGPTVNVGVQVNLADVEARVAQLRQELAADLAAIGLTTDQQLVLAERWASRTIPGEVVQ